MKLLTNELNASALKIFIAGTLSHQEIDYEIVSTEDYRFQTPRRLPVLLLDSGSKLFSPNIAARFLLPPKPDDERQVDEWLEWESSQLQPLLAHVLNVSNKPDAAVRSQLADTLAFVDKALEDKKYLNGKTLSVADVVVWSALYPVATEPKLCQDWLSSKSNLHSWFGILQLLEPFKFAVTKLKLKPGVICHKALVAATWFPTIATVAQSPTLATRLQSVSSVDGSVKDAALSEDGSVKEHPITESELADAVEAWEHGAARRKKPRPVHKPVLPLPDERNILITSALPYVNNVPHLGNIIGCVLSADVFARFCRLRGYNTLFVCGTDEYGTATETKALEEGLTPQQICDKYFAVHDAIYKWFNISFDHFGRTSSPEQTKICQEIFLQVHENGFTSTEAMEQLLCESCNRYLADRFVEGTCPRCAYEDARGDQCDGCGHLINATELIKPRCKLCQRTPVIRQSDQFFLELPKVEDKLRKWMDGTCNGWSNNARVIARSWLRDGLKPRCITRDLKWGIPVPLPGYSDKVFYVWFDAPIGYISITCQYTDKWRQWWQPDKSTPVSLYQFMAKDNVPFHSVMFPCTLLAADKNYTIVSKIMATEYLNYEDGKFSKSRGVGVFGTDAQDTGIPSDVWRFYLLYLRPESQDSNFSWIDLATKNNSELLNNLGNFINRALVFLEKFFNGIIPTISVDAACATVLAQVTRELKSYLTALEKGRLRDGVRHILSISRIGNQYMQSQKPWELVKGSDAERVKASTTVGTCCNLSCLLAVLIQPYMPASSKLIKEQLNAPDDLFVIGDEVIQLLPAGHKIGKPAPLFTKIEADVVEKLRKQYSGRQKSQSPPDTKKNTPLPGAKEATVKLEEAVKKQTDLVNSLKAKKGSEKDLKLQTTVLNEMKEQLGKMVLTNGQVTTEAANGVGPADPAEVDRLTEEVAKQGQVVRNLKTSGAPPSEWQPQVVILQNLKQQLAVAQGEDPSTVLRGGKKKGKK